MVRTRKRGDTYSYSFEAGTRGKRKVVEKGGFPTLEDAYAAGVKAYAAWQHGNIGMVVDKILVIDYLRMWLTERKAEIKPGTYQAYQIAMTDRRATFWEGIYIQDVTPLICDKWVKSLLSAGYAYKTIRQAVAVFSNAFKYAVYPGQLLQSNPLDYIKIPRTAPKQVIPRVIVDEAKLDELMNAFPYGDMYHIPILLALHTGMRRGELLGLTWDNCDLTKGIIHITQQRTMYQNKPYITTPKTASSVRDVLLDDFSIQLLKRWRNTITASKLEMQDRYITAFVDNGFVKSCSAVLLPKDAKVIDLVCTATNGRLVQAGLMSKKLKEHGVNAHSFRHTHATMLAEAGAPAKGIAARLGHTKTDITENLYTHITRQLEQDTLRKLNNAK